MLGPAIPSTDDMELSRRERSVLMATAVTLLVFLALQVAAILLDLLAIVADVLLIFLVAWAVSYLLDPLVRFVERRSVFARLGAVAVVYLALFVVLAVVLALGVPTLAAQLAALAERGPEFGERAARMVIDLQTLLDRAGVRVDIEDIYGAIPERLGALTGAVAADALGVVAATGALLFNATLVLIIAFFMLLDGDGLWTRFTAALPGDLRSEAELLRQSADRSFGGFLRASLLLALIYGTATLLILAPFGVPFAGLLAVVAGLVMIIPFFGPLIAMVPVLAATILGAPGAFIPVLLLTMLLQQVTLNVIGPRLMANVIGIHPLFVFLAILLGARIAGFWGVLLAMPVAGIANTFLRYGYEIARGRRTRAQALLLFEPEADKGPAEEPGPRGVTVTGR